MGGQFSLNQGDNRVRSIWLMYDDKWDFHSSGEPLAFEDVERYKEKFARNRFTPEMLDKYCKAMGIDFFNEDFYLPKGSTAYIIEEVRPPWPNEKSVTLEEMRKDLGFE